MQGNDFVQSLMYTRGVTCCSCHDPHGTRQQRRALIKPAQRALPHVSRPAIAERPARARPSSSTRITNAGSPGNECVACHMPKIAQTIADVNVRSHTFKFIVPAVAERLNMPNPCTTCHRDKNRAWATEALQRWPEFSPWRVGR